MSVHQASLMVRCPRRCGVEYVRTHHGDHSCHTVTFEGHGNGMTVCGTCQVMHPTGHRHECNPTGTVYWADDGTGWW